MKQFLLSLLFFSVISATFAQTSIDVLLKDYNSRTVPYISVQELEKEQSKYLILDTRKQAEYDVSHIPGAIWVGEQLDTIAFAKAYPTKSITIAVYCSVGIRSEDFGEQLLAIGYTSVKNVYGSIFSWKDAGYVLENLKGQKTDSVHVFSQVWSSYLKTGIKVY